MVGILDILAGNNAAASPWGMLYPSPLLDPALQLQQEKGQAPSAPDAAAYGALGVDPSALMLPKPPVSPFPDVGQPNPPTPPATGFGAGATPFGFAGPGSMSGIDPAMFARPAPAAAPQVAQTPDAPPSDLSSVQRPAPDGDTPDSYYRVGNYNVPVFGKADDSAPAAAPVPARTPGAPSAPVPFSLAGAGGAVGDRLMKATRGFMGNMAAGPIGALAGGLGALVTGQNTDPTSIAAEKTNATGQALLNKGASLEDVKAAINNPALMAAMIQQFYGKDKYKVTQTGEDGLGGKTYKLFNETDGTFKDIPGSANAGSGARAGGAGGLGNMDLKGEEYLSSVPTQQANIIRGMIDGTIAPPSSFALAKPYWQAMIAAAKNVDPSFDQTNWSARLAGAKDFSAGKSSEMVRAANQTLHHTGQLLDSMDGLGNRSVPLWNKVANAADEATGGGAQTSFRLNAHAVSEELSKVFKGSNLSDAEIRAWEHNLHENMSPEQQRAAVGKLRDLLQGSLHALDEKRVGSLGQIGADKMGPIIKPEGQAVLKRIDDWLAKGSGPSAAPAAAAARGSVNVGGASIPWSVN